MSKDWESLRDSMEVALKQEIAGMIDGSISDLEGPIRDAANRLSVAVRRGPAGEALVEEIRDQLAIAVLRQKLKAQAAGGNVLNMVLGVGLNLLFQGAIGGLAAVKPN